MVPKIYRDLSALVRFQGWTGMYTLVVPSLSTKFIKTVATRIYQFSQHLGTKLDMLSEIAK